MKVQTSREFYRKCAKCGPLKNANTWEISMKVQTPQGFHQKCTKCGPLKNSTLRKYWWKIKLLKSCIENVLSMNLWKIAHSENTNESPNSSRVSSKYTKCEPLKKSTFRKHRWKSELLKSFIENVLRVDLWKIPHLGNMDGRSNFSRAPSKCTEYGPLKNSTLRKKSMKDRNSQGFHRKCTKCGPLKNSTLRKYRWKTELLKGFIGNVLSVDLWKIPHLENIHGRSNFSKVSSECSEYRFSRNFTLRKIRWKSELLKNFIVNVLSVYLRKIPHLENIDERPNFSRVSS